ncbi:tyrosine 3-monooxygenase-like [Amblyraja radiata]|uniref:tyrosine 3-monooxygenase-like n=1 Tax=Amblyraja radiata TaxID=386614 RepID=UPI001401D93C|nr:tyrosine 3-monooxygenase-like [Amblyraja radiata]
MWNEQPALQIISMKTEVGSRSPPDSLAEDGVGSSSRNSAPSPADRPDPPILEEPPKVLATFIFTLPDARNAGLSLALKLFEGVGARVSHLESRAARESRTSSEDLDIFIRCELPSAVVSPLLNSLKRVTKNVSAVREKEVPWFPRSRRDLDMCQQLMTKFEPNLDQDHPGHNDPEYRERRLQIAGLAVGYKQGEPIPRVEYTAKEIEIWKVVYTKLTTLYPSHACKQFLDAFRLLEQQCGYRADNIPQLQDVSVFLQGRTGFQLRPVAGLLSARDFLASLAFSVFQCTQYIRHPTSPMHSPEPDCCHELLGHVPMLADAEFAQFSQELGLASLGAADEDIEKLSTLYWFTIEFGLCKQNGALKAYGAGLLSSYGELMYALSGQPQYKDFDPQLTAHLNYQDQTYQPAYFVAESFEDAKSKLWAYASNIRKPFSLRYRPLTWSVEIPDRPDTGKDALTHGREDLNKLYFAHDKPS